MDFQSDQRYLNENPSPEETEAVLLLAREQSPERAVDIERALVLLSEVRRNKVQVERHVWRVLRKQMRSRPYRGSRAAVFTVVLLAGVALVALVVGFVLSWF